MNVREQHIVTGMVTDMNVSKFEPTKVLYARNIRITQVEGNQGLLCVTNEKGTQQCSLSSSLVGTIVGSAVLNDYLIVFTHGQSSTDYIYRLENTTGLSFTVVQLFSGNLGFSVEHPLETLCVYENNLIQKVYWVDGVHQLRCINIADTSARSGKVSVSGESAALDANPTINFSHVITTTKNNFGGDFPAGTIQYAFTYFNTNGSETNVFETTPLYELCYKEKGIAADARTTCSFNINIATPDTTFEYIRVYAIIRTSENATPNVRIIGDFKTANSVNVYDNGAVGSTVDATYLLFVGGEPVAPATFTSKDNTLFLGNVKLQRPSIGNLNIASAGVTISQFFRNLYNSGAAHVTNVSSQVDNTAGSGDWFYDYTINNNRPSTGLKKFKRGETYRLGFIAQHETGIWSDAVWIGDYKNDVKPVFYSSVVTPTQSSGIFKMSKGTGTSSIDAALTTLIGAGYKRIAPVIVYPEGKDRAVFCQGIISATVYNVEDRFNNRPFSQASWFFRPITEGFGIAAIPHATLYPTKLNKYTEGSSGNQDILGNAEIQLNTNPRNFLPHLKGTWAGGTEAVIDAADMIAMFGNDYYVDTSILTFNSPEIELDDYLQQEDIQDLKFRIVGIAKSGIQDTVANVIADFTAGDDAQDRFLSYELSRFLKANYSTYSFGSYPSYPGYLSFVKYSEMSPNPDFYNTFILYPWHKTGSIYGYNTSNEETNEYSLLNSKTLSTLRFAHTELFDYSDAKYLTVNTKPIKLFDDTQGDFIPLGDTADSNVYYGNVDSVRIYKKDLLKTVSNAGKVLTMKEPRVLENQAKLAIVTRDPVSTDRYRITVGPAINTTDTVVAGVHNGNIESVLSQFNYERDIQIGSFFQTYDDDAPVQIRYKSTRHAVISLAGLNDSEIPSLYRCEALHTAYNGASSQATTINPFWNSGTTYSMSVGKVPFGNEWTPSFSYNKTWTSSRDSYKNYNAEIPFAYIGELYREDADIVARFGGNTEEALKSNIWKKCGDAISISSLAGGSAVTLDFVEGDTFLARYDCLKTYPYTENDVNSIVEILSTDLETRVNLDARYDNARGLMDNTYVRPENINLINRLGFEQTNQFFTFTTEDTDNHGLDSFPNLISITSEKTLGEKVDSWLQTTLTSTYDANGEYGNIQALKTWNDTVFIFQDNAFGQVLFNSRVQIPTSDGQPIEITNGMKFQGIRYLSNKIGCSNKWSIALSNSKIYWYDNGSKDFWSFGGSGLDNLSTRLGVRGIAPSFTTKTFHDERNNDIYFSSGTAALLYSETLDAFISVLDYNDLFAMHSVESKPLALTSSAIHGLWAGSYNSLFGVQRPYMIRFIANYQPLTHKVFNTVQWRSDSWDSNGKYLPKETFNKLQVENQYQQTAVTSLVEVAEGKAGPIKKKFNTFRATIPRDTQGNLKTLSDLRYKGFSRIRGNYAIVELTHDADDAYKMQLYDFEVGEFL